MKKKICTILLLCLSLFAVAQTKKVAILETVDREGNISYANKLIVRSNLAKAITNTPGYEAYDRTDMDAILGEQNFQRTGLVSNEQIKRLGEMTGAAYVLVAEVVQADQKTMYIIAKLLDVETGRIEATENQLVGANAKEIQVGCVSLAKQLLNVQSEQPTSQKKENKNVKKEVGYQLEKINGSYERSADGKKIAYALVGTDVKLDKKAYEHFLQNNCPAAWKKYHGGKQAVAAGWSLLGIGAVMGIGGYIGYDYNESNYYRYSYTKEVTYVSLCVTGIACAVVGVITFPIGYGVKNTAYKTYNKSCSNKDPKLSMSIQASQNGFGLALNF